MKQKAFQHFSISALQQRFFISFSLFSFLFSLAFAQLATGTNPEQVADDAVRAWLETSSSPRIVLANRSLEEICADLPALLNTSPSVAGSSVNFANRKEQATDDTNIKRYTYPVTIPVTMFGFDAGERLEILSVTLTKTAEMWQADNVSYQSLQQPSGVRQWLQTPIAGMVFIAFTFYILFLLVRPSAFRTWLSQGMVTIRAHRGLVIGTVVALYLVFGLGAYVGSGLPLECQTAITEIVTNAIQMTGAVEAYGNQNLATAAAVTFYQNFAVVSLTLLFTAGLFFGLPAYLISTLQFFTLGIPFGFSLDRPLEDVFLILILLLLELTAYFLVISGGGILLVTVVRKGLRSFSEGVRALALMLPFALLLLLLGAWYEAAILILLQLFGAP
ncbi:MAG: hypothetical protein ACRCYY_13165 [Trueperaceae bacterium]